MNTLTLNKVLLNARPLNMRKRIVKDKDFYYKVLDREFSFSITAGGKRIKSSTATISRLKGNSVVWNQKLAPRNQTSNGITSTYQNGKFHSVGQITDIYFHLGTFQDNILNHTYLFIVDGLSSSFSGILALLNRNSTAAVNNGFAYIFHNNTDSSKLRYIGFDRITVGEEIDETYSLVQYDLTKMFGAGNEPTTIEEFYARKPIVEDEYAYNEGEVIHMTAEGIKSVGDNAWDEEWEIGGINYNSGLDLAVTSKCRNRGFVKVLPNEEYYLSSPSFGELSSAVVICYDENKQFMNHIGGGSANARFTIPSDCHYIRFTWVGSTYNHDIMITLVHSGWKQDTDAGYQPYWADTLPLPIIRKYFPQGMKSAGSAHDEIRFNKASGKWEAVQRIGSVDLGTLEWSRYADGFYLAKNLTYAASTAWGLTQLPNVVSSRYAPALWDTISESNRDKACSAYDSQVRVSDTDYTDAASFKAAMQGVILYYELAEPIVTELDAEDQNFRDYYQVADFGTEQAIAEQPSAPISAEIGYHMLKNNLELTLNS